MPSRFGVSMIAFSENVKTSGTAIRLLHKGKARCCSCCRAVRRLASLGIRSLRICVNKAQKSDGVHPDCH